MLRIRPGRLLLTIFILGFAIFFGLDLATRGTVRIAGTPVQGSQAGAVAHQPQPQTKPVQTVGERTAAGAAVKQGANGGKAVTAQASQVQTGTKQAAQDDGGSPAQVKESFLNHLSNRVGDALHKGAKALMGLIVSIFDALIS